MYYLMIVSKTSQHNPVPTTFILAIMLFSSLLQKVLRIHSEYMQ